MQNNVSFEERDIVTDRPSAQELAQWYRQSGLPLKRFFNTSGLAYRGLGLKDKLPGMAEEEQLALLATDGMLVKRPSSLRKRESAPDSRPRFGKPCYSPMTSGAGTALAGPKRGAL